MTNASEHRVYLNFRKLIQKAIQQLDSLISENNWEELNKISFKINDLINIIYKDDACVQALAKELKLLSMYLKKAHTEASQTAQRLDRQMKNLRQNRAGLIAYQEAEFLWQ